MTGWLWSISVEIKLIKVTEIVRYEVVGGRGGEWYRWQVGEVVGGLGGEWYRWWVG